MKCFNICRKNKIRKIIIYDEDEKNERIKLKEKLEKTFIFNECVYSFVKGKSSKDAIKDVVKNVKNYEYAIKCDIEDYFNSINVDKLIKILERNNLAISYTNKIKKILSDEQILLGTGGIALGSPLSPILSNIYLIEFDTYFQNYKGIKYYRFCDDMLFLCNNNILDLISERLDLLDLKLSKEKTKIVTKGDSFEFLGYVINTSECKVMKYMDNKKITGTEVKGYFAEDSDDFNGLVNSIKNCNKERFLELISKMDFNIINPNITEKLISNVEKALGIEYAKLLEVVIKNKEKEQVIEELVEQNLFNVAARFEEIYLEVKSKSEYVSKFRRIFDNGNAFYYVFDEKLNEYLKINNSIDENIIKNHLNGIIAVSIRLDKINGTSNILVFDIDCNENLEEAYNVAKGIKLVLKDKGYTSYIEFSGKKGYHVWVFFDEFYSLKIINKLADEVVKSVDTKSCVIETKPKEVVLSESENCIKLPLGIHPITKKRSTFIDLEDVNDIVKNTILFDVEKSSDWIEGIKEKYPEAYKIINNCSVIKKIILLGLNKRNLSHFDRLILLYNFAFIDKGSEFIHYYMSNLDNYSYNITEKYISRAPERPISCKKIKEYLKDTNYVDVCECKFEISDGFYPTPVLHSDISSFSNQALIMKAKSFFKELSDLKNEREELDKKIKSIEKKLNNIFNVMNTNEIDIEIGKLKRIDKDGNISWIIEINF
ncbi:non-homologous end-joining DNA ligase LigD [Thermobrachium celere]|uniref:non-homologous end-joining DNA ligase LigD n=1 Tax=Thermobrachium celere TaxID=53422 RepID=UPI0019409E1F|nr:reverse transcriptase domain-containing protein [Thermobrachium celere]GFR36591.1 hypothetical protein TCEA9_24030 [Thermobrachium celere]